MSSRSSGVGSEPALSEPRFIRWILIGGVLAFLSVFLLAPLIVVFQYAFSDGVSAYLHAVSDPLARSAIKLTLIAAVSAVVINTAFGLAFAWLVSHYRFRGRSVLLTLLDIPLAVSPVVAGMVFVLLLGAKGWFGPLFERIGVSIIFSTPGIIICTCFVTIPFVAREILPVLEERGGVEESAALVLGASGWQTFRFVTLPALKWAILYGVVLCNARAMGEFGAVSVVSGHIRGRTNTMPLHIEILYNEYNFTAAFAVSSLLALLALVTLAVKRVLELRVIARREGLS